MTWRSRPSLVCHTIFSALHPSESGLIHKHIVSSHGRGLVTSKSLKPCCPQESRIENVCREKEASSTWAHSNHQSTLCAPLSECSLNTQSQNARAIRTSPRVMPPPRHRSTPCAPLSECSLNTQSQNARAIPGAPLNCRAWLR